MHIDQKLHNTGTVLVYTLILVIISLFMALVILAVSGLLSSNLEYEETNRELSNRVYTRGDFAIQYSTIVNSNGSGFVDSLGCPTSVTMSGTTSGSSRTTSSSTLQYLTGNIVCTGTHVGDTYIIHFSTGGSMGDTTAEFLSTTRNISSGISTSVFGDSELTRMNYSASLPTSSDGIDDNFNSDDYRVTSVGTTVYPNGYQDDDAAARKTIYGYADVEDTFVNMIWNNTDTSNYIENNPYNTGALNERIGSMTSSGHMYVNVSKDHRLKLYVLDKSTYNSSQELLSTDIYESADSSATAGYIQLSGTTLGTSGTKTGNEFEFDFQENDYALFVKNNATGSLLYSLTLETITGTGVYINPIDDSSTTLIKVLANDIVINSEGRLIPEQFEVVGFK